MSIKTKIFENAIKFFENNSSKSYKITLFCHQNSDADSIGSCLALSMYWEKIGYKTTIICPDMIPGYLKWLPNCKKLNHTLL